VTGGDSDPARDSPDWEGDRSDPESDRSDPESDRSGPFGDPSLAVAAMDALGQSVAVLDAEGTIRYVNEEWRRFGRENGLDEGAAPVGANYLAVSGRGDDEFASRATEGIRSVLDGDRDAFELEYPCHSPAERRWFLMRATPLDRDGERYVAVVHLDVTERRRAEVEVGRHAAELQARTETLALLNGIVGHDIRNDMEAVLGYAERLADRLEGEDRREIEEVIRAGRGVVDLTRTVGDLVSVVEGGEDPDLHPVDLAAVVAEEAEKVRSAFGRRPGSVTIRGPADPPGDARVLADDLLGSVVGNLLDNAVLHNDSADPRVEVDLRAEGEDLVLTVDDDGPGIDPERRDAVFGREEKGLESSGSGLGLYLVDRLVDLYGGTVEIADSDLGGARFRVWLPRVTAPDELAGDAAAGSDR